MNRSSRTVKLVEMALLVAIILILAFTPLGYIKTLGLEITLIVVPVTIGAIILGPLGGAVLGAVFGITSFIQCFGMSPFGAVLLGINPFGTFVVCVVSRILMGWLTGLIYKGLSKFPKMKNWKIAEADGRYPVRRQGGACQIQRHARKGGRGHGGRPSQPRENSVVSCRKG